MDGFRLKTGEVENGKEKRVKVNQTHRNVKQGTLRHKYTIDIVCLGGLSEGHWNWREEAEGFDAVKRETIKISEIRKKFDE